MNGQYDVCQRYGLSVTHIGMLVEAGLFPAPDSVTEMAWTDATLAEYDRQNAINMRDTVKAVTSSAHDCAHCGQRFYAKRKDARYCSKRCRTYACRQRAAYA